MGQIALWWILHVIGLLATRGWKISASTAVGYALVRRKCVDCRWYNCWHPDHESTWEVNCNAVKVLQRLNCVTVDKETGAIYATDYLIWLWKRSNASETQAHQPKSVVATVNLGLTDPVDPETQMSHNFEEQWREYVVDVETCQLRLVKHGPYYGEYDEYEYDDDEYNPYD